MTHSASYIYNRRVSRGGGDERGARPRMAKKGSKKEKRKRKKEENKGREEKRERKLREKGKNVDIACI